MTCAIYNTHLISFRCVQKHAHEIKRLKQPELIIKKTILFDHCHKKRKDSLEGSLDRVLLATELEFPKIPVHWLPQNTSNVNTEYARKPKRIYF